MVFDRLTRRSTSLILLALLCCALRNGPAEADRYPRQLGVDLIEYIFRIELSDESDRIRGLTTLDVLFTQNGVSEILLDLIGPTDEGKGMQVSGVWAADPLRYDDATSWRPTPENRGTEIPFDHSGDRLRIELPTPSETDQRLYLTVAYDGVPVTGLEIGETRHGERAFFSENWPNNARQWLPTIDHPYDKAMGRMVVTAPVHYQVISNGLLIEETDLEDGRRLTVWKQSVPIASWLYTLGVARFAVQRLPDFDGKPVQTWVYAQDRDAGFYDFAVPTHDVLAFYSRNVGPFSYEKLANIQTHSVGGGMESASAIFYGEDSVTGERTTRWRNVIIHEIAHQWFGNAVTQKDWDDVWLSEGFATYFTHLYIEHAHGRDELVTGLLEDRDRIFEFYEENPDYRLIHDNLDDMSKVLTRMQYIKGSWILHMLRGLIGTEAFWDGIRDYYRLYRNSNTSTAEFRRIMERVSGQELAWFLDQWLYQGGLPVVAGIWSYDSAEATVELHFRQTQETGHLFQLPMTVRIHLKDGSTHDHLVDLVGEEAEFSLPVEGTVTEVELDPDSWILMRSSLERR